MAKSLIDRVNTGEMGMGRFGEEKRSSSEVLTERHAVQTGSVKDQEEGKLPRPMDTTQVDRLIRAATLQAERRRLHEGRGLGKDEQQIFAEDSAAAQAQEAALLAADEQAKKTQREMLRNPVTQQEIRQVEAMVQRGQPFDTWRQAMIYYIEINPKQTYDINSQPYGTPARPTEGVKPGDGSGTFRNLSESAEYYRRLNNANALKGKKSPWERFKGLFKK